MTTKKVSKLVRLKEWISLEEARALLSDLIDENISPGTFISEVTMHLPLCIEPAERDAGYFGGISENKLETHPKLKRDLDGRSAQIELRPDDDLTDLFDLIATRLPYRTRFDSPSLISPQTANLKTKQRYTWFVMSLNDKVATSFDPRDSSLVTVSTETKAVLELAERIAGKTPWKGSPKTIDVKTHADASKGNGHTTQLVSPIPLTHSNAYRRPPESEDVIRSRGTLLLVICSLVEQATKASHVNQERLIMEIIERFEGRRGLSQSSLQKLFADANTLGAES